MAYIKFAFPQQREMTIYPLVCMHIGAPQCDMGFLREHLKRIADDPNARWVYMGDGGDCVTKYSKGDLYGQLLSPQLQQNVLIDLLAPIKDKGLFGIRGNHGHRVFKETGLSFDATLCRGLGIPYLGVASFANLVVGRSSYDLYFHHGIDSGVALRTKIGKAEEFGKFIDADAIFTAHSHVAMALQPSALLGVDNVNGKVVTKMRHQYICGSSYDSRTGYAEDKGYPPLLPSYLSVAFDGHMSGGKAKYRQTEHIYRSDGQRDLSHGYIQQYLEQITRQE